MMIFTAFITALWFLLSGYFTFLPVAPGIFSIIMVVILYKLSKEKSVFFHNMSFRIRKLFVYLLGLLKDILISNLTVAYAVLINKYNPKVIKLDNPFSSRSASVCYTNSIILTPGTIVLEENKDFFLLHIMQYNPEFEYDNVKLIEKINNMDLKYESPSNN